MIQEKLIHVYHMSVSDLVSLCLNKSVVLGHLANFNCLMDADCVFEFDNSHYDYPIHYPQWTDGGHVVFSYSGARYRPTCGE